MRAVTISPNVLASAPARDVSLFGCGAGTVIGLNGGVLAFFICRNAFPAVIEAMSAIRL